MSDYFSICKECKNNNMYEDHVSGDVVCTQCGLVCNRDNQFHTDFYITETQNSVYIDSGNIKKEVIFLIKKFKMKIYDQELVRLVCEWICFAKVPFTTRFLTCAVYLQLNSDNGSLYLTNDLIEKWSNKMNISFLDLQTFLKRNCNSSFYNDEAISSNKLENTTSSIEEWIKNLQQTSKQIIQNNFPSYDRKLFIKVNTECRRIVTTKKETIFHNLQYVSAAIIHNLISNIDLDSEFDKNVFKILDKKKVLKIKRLIYN